MTVPDFLEKIFTSKFGEMEQRLAKNKVVLNLLKDLVINFLLNSCCSKNILLCSYTNPIFGKIFVPEKLAKIFTAIQIVGFFNQPYLQNKSIK